MSSECPRSQCSSVIACHTPRTARARNLVVGCPRSSLGAASSWLAAEAVLSDLFVTVHPYSDCSLHWEQVDLVCSPVDPLCWPLLPTVTRQNLSVLSGRRTTCETLSLHGTFLSNWLFFELHNPYVPMFPTYLQISPYDDDDDVFYLFLQNRSTYF